MSNQDTKQQFLDNAFLLWENSDRILADKRMSMALVPIDEQHPIPLCVLLELWETRDPQVLSDGKGREALIYDVAGNPLTGTNGCSCVYRNGTTARVSLRNFHPIWVNYIKSIQKYKNQHPIGTLSLEEVVQTLKSG